MKALLVIALVIFWVPAASIISSGARYGPVRGFWFAVHDLAVAVDRRSPSMAERNQVERFVRLIRTVRERAADLADRSEFGPIIEHAQIAAAALPAEPWLQGELDRVSSTHGPRERPGERDTAAEGAEGRRWVEEISGAIDRAALVRSMTAISATLLVEAPDCARSLPQMPSWVIGDVRSEVLGRTGAT